MTIPSWQEALLPLLLSVQDEKEHTLTSCKAFIATYFQLSPSELLPSGKNRLFDNRVEWAKFHLSKAKLIENTGHGRLRITQRGKAILDISPTRLTMKFLFIFPEYTQFRNPTLSKVFISHGSDTLDFCNMLAQGLRSRNVNVWLDESNLHNGAISEEIESELLSCDTFILVLSPKATESQWVKQEYQAALELLHSGDIKSFIPVMAMECAVPLFVRTYKMVASKDTHAIDTQNAVKQVLSIINSNQA